MRDRIAALFLLLLLLLAFLALPTFSGRAWEAPGRAEGAGA